LLDFKLKPGDTIYISDENTNILDSVYIPEKFRPEMGEYIARQPDGSYRVMKN
jgi:hypothetical protein